MCTEQVFFFIFIPSLLAEHVKRFGDISKVKGYPYRTRLPASPVFYLCQRHPELQSSRIAQHALGSLAADASDEDIVKELGDIYHDTVWAPSPRTRLLLFGFGIFMLVPDIFQELIFEEIFTLCPLATGVMFNYDFIPGGLDQRRVARVYFRAFRASKLEERFRASKLEEIRPRRSS